MLVIFDDIFFVYILLFGGTNWVWGGREMGLGGRLMPVELLVHKEGCLAASAFPGLKFKGYFLM